MLSGTNPPLLPPPHRNVALQALLTLVTNVAGLPPGFAAPRGVSTGAAPPLATPRLSALPAPPGLSDRFLQIPGYMRVARRTRADCQHALAQYHEAHLACSRVVWEALGANLALSQQMQPALSANIAQTQHMHAAQGEIMAIQHEVATLHEAEADRLNEDGDRVDQICSI
ncbi:MAG: hypothetical protein M1829_000450 [Trizodia sp. TS-e1964]|nr:MAG: hypothetical protein M1829_000450 [Trizodia sp. TS-e1964]